MRGELPPLIEVGGFLVNTPTGASLPKLTPLNQRFVLLYTNNTSLFLPGRSHRTRRLSIAKSHYRQGLVFAIVVWGEWLNILRVEPFSLLNLIYSVF